MIKNTRKSPYSSIPLQNIGFALRGIWVMQRKECSMEHNKRGRQTCNTFTDTPCYTPPTYMALLPHCEYKHKFPGAINQNHTSKNQLLMVITWTIIQGHPTSVGVWFHCRNMRRPKQDGWSITSSLGHAPTKWQQLATWYTIEKHADQIKMVGVSIHHQDSRQSNQNGWCINLPSRHTLTKSEWSVTMFIETALAKKYKQKKKNKKTTMYCYWK